MNIGIDIDGVIFDTERDLKFYADYWSHFTLKKDRLRSDDVTQEHCFDWKEDEINFFYENYFDKLTKKAHLVVGVKEILKQLKQEGHKLFVVTLRGYYRKEEKKDAEKKLKSLKIKFDGIHWSVKDKIKKCKELGIDVFIDDNADNVEQFANSNINVLYFKEEPTRNVSQPNVKKVSSWMDIYMAINTLAEKNQGTTI